MQLRPDALTPQLAKTLAPIWVIHGDEPLLVTETADAVRSAAKRQGYTERDVLVAGPGFKWQELTMAAGNLSLFGGNKLVDLRIPSGKPGKEGGEALVRYGNEASRDVLLLVTLPELDWSARKAAWFTTLLSAGTVVECNAPPLAELPAWVGRRLAAQQQQAEPSALEFIAAHVEGNLLAAHQEIQKLGLLHPVGTLTLAQVQDAVLNVARFDTDKLRQALLEGDLPRCARLIDGLRAEGIAPLQLLWGLTTEARSLAAIRAGLDRGEAMPALLKAERIYEPNRARAVQQAVSRLTTPTLRLALQHAARLDRMIKGLADGDIWDEFLQFCLRLSRRRR